MSNNEDISYNFDSLDDTQHQIKKDDNNEAPQNNDPSTQKPKFDLWSKIRPMLHFYIIGLIGIFVACYMMYNAYSSLYPEKKVTSAPKNMTFSGASSIIGDQKKTVQATLNSKFSQIRQNSAKTQQTISDIDNQLNTINNNLNKLASLTTKNTLNKSDVDQLLNEVKTIKNNSDKALEHNQQTINGLQTELTKQSHEIDDIKQLLLNRDQKLDLLISNQYNHRDHLTLRAILSGRAWLTNDKGVTMSVVKGSKIDGYGSVVKINDDNPSVVMSSGFIFK